MKRIRGEILAFVIIFITITSKIIQFVFLPSKYFYDAIFIKKTMDGEIDPDKSFQFTAKFFNGINVLNISTVAIWSLVLTAIATAVICAYLFKKRQSYSVGDALTILSTIILLNIYAFTLSKEIIQILFFAVAALVIKKSKNTKKATAMLVVLFLIESIIFRSYYILLAELIVIMLCVLKTNNSYDKKWLLRKLMIGLAVFMTSFFVVSSVSVENYDSVMNARYGVNINRQTSLDARTIINDPFGKNTSFVIFSANYAINLIRLLFPIELISKGTVYILFIIYQGLFDYFVWDKITKERNNQKKLLGVVLIISFVAVSAIFEPDFGSFTRHESCLLPILMIIKGEDKKIKIPNQMTAAEDRHYGNASKTLPIIAKGERICK